MVAHFLGRSALTFKYGGPEIENPATSKVMRRTFGIIASTELADPEWGPVDGDGLHLGTYQPLLRVHLLLLLPKWSFDCRRR